MSTETRLLDLPLLLARRLVASTAEFQLLTGSAGMSQAMPSVYIEEADDLPESGEQARARAIVGWDNYRRNQLGTSGTYETSGAGIYLLIELEAETDADFLTEEGLSGKQAERAAFNRRLSAILGQMQANSGQDQGDGSSTTHLNMIAWSVAGVPSRFVVPGVDESETVYWGAAFLLEFE